MKGYLLTSFYGLLLCGFLLTGCTEEQRENGRRAEAAYVDLLLALHLQDSSAATAAADAFDLEIRELRRHWYRPLREEDMDLHFYHLEKAEWAYADARTSIAAGDLVLAAVQLDRATYELSAADPATFNELYVGAIYPFLSSWLEVDYAIHDIDMCQLDWDGFDQYARRVRALWRGARQLRPDPSTYPDTALDPVAFQRLRQVLDERMTSFVQTVRTEDQCLAQLEAREVTGALWELLSLFGRHPVTDS